MLAHLAGASITLPLLVVFVARASDGLTGGNVSVASAYLADLTADEPKIRQRAFGFMGMAASLGFAIGPAKVSELHCNFLINEGGATAAQLEELGETVRRRVQQTSGIDLEWEIKRIGVTA